MKKDFKEILMARLATKKNYIAQGYCKTKKEETIKIGEINELEYLINAIENDYLN